jgi:hypothetical protein
MDILEQISATPTCQTCRYYAPGLDPIDGTLTYGTCKRYPPQKDAVAVADADWCGEHTHG